MYNFQDKSWTPKYLMYLKVAHRVSLDISMISTRAGTLQFTGKAVRTRL